MQNKEQTKETTTKKKHVISNVKVTVHENRDSDKGEMIVEDKEKNEEAPEKTEAVQYTERESSNDALIGGKPCCCQGCINFIKTHLILSIIIGIIILIIILLAILLPILLTKSKNDDIEKNDEEPIIICDNCFRIYPIHKKSRSKSEVFSSDYLELSNAVKPKYIIDNKENIENLTDSWDGKYAINSDIEFFDVYFDKNLKTCEKMFKEIDIIDKIYLQNLITNDITSTESMFEDSSDITKIKISNFTNNKITTMKKMFSGCSNLESLLIDNFDTSKTTDMSELFEDCSKLTSLDLSNFDTKAVTTMSEIFKGCSKLSNLNVDFKSFITSKVTEMDGMFNGCKSLTSLDLSNLDTLSSSFSVTSMFSNTGLQKLCLSAALSEKMTRNDLPDNFDIVNNAGCEISHIKIYPIDDCKNKGCKYIGANFNGSLIPSLITDCSQSSTIELTKGEISLGSNVNNFNIYFNGAPDSLEELFSGITTIKKVEFYLNGSKLKSLASTFDGASNIEEINFGNLDTSKLISMKRMFYNCKKIKSLDLSKFKTQNVIIMGSVFGHCETLESLILSNNFVTDNVNDTSYMFYSCSIIQNLDLSTFTNNKIKTMEYMFHLCYGLKNVIFSKNFKTDLVENMKGVFDGCNNLISLDLSNWNPKKVNTTHVMFQDCEKLTSLKLPSSFDSLITMQSMFRNVGLTSLDLSGINAPKLQILDSVFVSSKFENINLHGFIKNTVTSLQNVFDSCQQLTNIKLTNCDTSGVTNMNAAFQNCTSLTSLNLCSFVFSNTVSYLSLFGLSTNLQTVDASSENEATIKTAIENSDGIIKDQVTVNIVTCGN